MGKREKIEDDAESFGRAKRPLDPAQINRLVASAPAGITATTADESGLPTPAPGGAQVSGRQALRRESAAARADIHQYPLRIPIEVFNAIEAKAKSVGNSVNTYVVRLIQAHLEGRTL